MFSLAVITVAVGVLAAQRYKGMILAALSLAALLAGIVSAPFFALSWLGAAAWTFGLIVASHVGYLLGSFLAVAEHKQPLTPADRNALS